MSGRAVGRSYRSINDSRRVELSFIAIVAAFWHIPGVQQSLRTGAHPDVIIVLLGLQ